MKAEKQIQDFITCSARGCVQGHAKKHVNEKIHENIRLPIDIVCGELIVLLLLGSLFLHC